MKNKLIKISLSLFMVAAIIGFGSKVYAFSGLLDEYEGYDFSDIGAPAVDSWTTYGHAYIEHWNDNSNAENYGVQVYLYKHALLGTSYVDSTTAYGSYSTITFTLPEKATYNLWFRANSGYKVDFHGNVWDYK